MKEHDGYDRNGSKSINIFSKLQNTTPHKLKWPPRNPMAGVTGLEPAASGVTGQRSNQLSYTPLGGDPFGAGFIR